MVKVLHSYTLDYLNNKLFKAQKTFRFQGNEYRYFVHKYNTTWRNERSIEIPIIWKKVMESRGKVILELGNVLGHYFPIKHNVVDKYEHASGVINSDIATFRPKKKYDLIVSISTLEHIGQDESPKEPKKIFRAIANLKRCLKPSGCIMATIPMGYNHYLDKRISEGKIRLSRVDYLKRISDDNIWKEVGGKEIKGVKYSKPYPNANAIIVGVIRK